MDVEKAKYRITGLVDIFDEQKNIIGTFPIGSVQELPVEVGVAAVADGRAEAVGTDETQEVPAEEPETEEAAEVPPTDDTPAVSTGDETGDGDDETEDEEVE